MCSVLPDAITVRFFFPNIAKRKCSAKRGDTRVHKIQNHVLGVTKKW